jgi:hypothetical protein
VRGDAQPALRRFERLPLAPQENPASTVIGRRIAASGKIRIKAAVKSASEHSRSLRARVAVPEFSTEVPDDGRRMVRLRWYGHQMSQKWWLPLERTTMNPRSAGRCRLLPVTLGNAVIFD